MINVKNLVKTYQKNIKAVKGVSFDINKGEIVGLLGPNGAGKTTIMRILTCYLAPSFGDAVINGVNVLDDPIAVKKLIGYLPEHVPIYEDMTVYEYLRFIASVREVPQDEVDSAINKMVEMTSLEGVIFKKIGHLSNGFQKRVGLASVMIHDPEILILDEPTTGLDPNQIITFRRIIRRFSEKKTVIISTHILSEIEAICEKVIIIKNGEVVANDTLQNLINNNSQDQIVDFSIETIQRLFKVEDKLRKIKSAWKIEFVKRISKEIFNFRALINKDSKFEADLNDLIKKENWKKKHLEKQKANLEEIFLKLAGEED